MELWDAYDENGVCTGGLLVRGEPIPENIYHLVTATVVQHTDGDILLMQRDPCKKSYPGKWEVGAGGSALAGEDAEAAARRELLEETGLRAKELLPLYCSIETERHGLYRGFLTEYDGDKNAVTLQRGETIAFRWISPAAFLAFCQTDEIVDVVRTRLAAWIASLP